jgi:hypothetical protein
VILLSTSFKTCFVIVLLVPTLSKHCIAGTSEEKLAALEMLLQLRLTTVHCDLKNLPTD